MRRTHILLASLFAVACSTTTGNRQPATSTSKPPLFGPHGFDLTGMDQTVKACDDFYRFAVGTGQLGLPDRDYYLRDDERFKNTRSQYVDHVTMMLSLAGEDAAGARSDAERILQLETKLAQAQMSRVEMRIPENRYHMMAVS